MPQLVSSQPFFKIEAPTPVAIMKQTFCYFCISQATLIKKSNWSRAASAKSTLSGNENNFVADVKIRDCFSDFWDLSILAPFPKCRMRPCADRKTSLSPTWAYCNPFQSQDLCTVPRNQYRRRDKVPRDAIKTVLSLVEICQISRDVRRDG